MEHLQGETAGIFLERKTHSAVTEYCEFATKIETAAMRMRGKTLVPNFGTLINRMMCGYYFADQGYGPNTFITDQADKLPFPKTVYHVSGGSVLDSLSAGKSLLPADAHYLADVKTDKGSMINLIPRFMESLGIQIGNLEQFVFSGPEIDWEQFTHIRKLKGVRISDLGRDMFFEKGNLNVLNSDLNIVLEALDHNVNVHSVESLKQAADRFIQLMWEIPNIREGWLDQITKVLYGDIAKKNTKDDIIFLLQTGMDMSRNISDVISKPPVVLEISTDRLIRESSVDGLFPVLVGNRPIESIFASVVITPGSVSGVYAHPDDIDNFHRSSYEVKSINEIPRGKSLGGVWWTDVDPKIDNPLCAVRYSQKSTTWRSIADSGMIAPAKNINQSALSVRPVALANIFGVDGFNFSTDEFCTAYPEAFAYSVEKNKPHIAGVFIN